MRRRSLFPALLAALAAPAALQAQPAWPAHALRLVVPYAPGGPADMLARLVAERLGARLGQPVVVENRPGAGGHTGAEMAARAVPDGYTLVLTTIAHNGASALYHNLRYDPARDLQPVVMLAESPSVLLVPAASPWHSAADLLAALRARPGEVAYASAGNGSAMHMAAELMKSMAHVDAVHVPYKGGAPAMTDLLGGQVGFMFDSLGTAHPYIEAGKVRALAVTGPARDPSLPQVPTLAEAAVPGYASVPWYELSVARGVPPAVVDRLNAEANAVLRLPEVAQRLEPLGVRPLGGTPQEAQQRNEAETRKWGALIRQARLRAE